MPVRFDAARRARRFAAVALAAAVLGGPAASAAAAAPPTMYYVAMGDSLGAGVGATTGANSYVQLVYQHELARIPGLQLQNFSCSGATTSSVLNSHGCGASVTQLAAAESFLQAHPGRIAFVTIDIGGNDVDGCTSAGGIDTTCIANGFAAIGTNLPNILNGLKASYPNVKVFGMNYYDPFLATWLTGADGQTLAHQSVTQSDAFNTLLASRYSAAGFRTADVAAAFQTDDFSLTGSYNNETMPQNVANACNWTYMCTISDFHTNDAGHAVLAQSFEQVIDTPTAPGVPTSVAAAPGNGSVTLQWHAPAIDGGSPLTGYVVTPYVGAIAKPARPFDSTATTEAITGLANGTVYTFRVAAKNAIGTGAQSAAGSAIAAGAPLSPTGASAIPGSGTARVQWTVPASSNGAPITGYAIAAYHGTTLTQSVAVGVGAHWTITGLVNGATYTFKVAARNARGASHAAATLPIVVGAPTAPAAVVATPNAGRATLRWAAPATNNGAPVKAYLVTPYTGGAAQPVQTFSTVNVQVVTGLIAGHTYRFRVAARNARGVGPQSLPSNLITPT